MKINLTDRVFLAEVDKILPDSTRNQQQRALSAAMRSPKVQDLVLHTLKEAKAEVEFLARVGRMQPGRRPQNRLPDNFNRAPQHL